MNPDKKFPFHLILEIEGQCYANTEYRKSEGGEIYLHNFWDNTGSIQNGVRLVLVVQSDEGNQTSTTMIVAALLSFFPTCFFCIILDFRVKK